MPILITMPAILADASEATLSAWTVSPGETVEAGQAIADIETEKAMVELEAESSGTIARLLAEEQSLVRVGGPLAVLALPGDSEDDVAKLLSSGVIVSGGTEQAPQEDSTTKENSSAELLTDFDNNHDGTSQSSTTRLFISPLARKLAKDHRLNVDEIDGTGPGGRIVRNDIERLLKSRQSSETGSQALPEGEVAEVQLPAPMPVNADDQLEIVPLSPMRRAIARRLTESKTEVPHFYASLDVVMDPLLSLRKDVNATLSQHDLKASVNDLILMALGKALALVPSSLLSWTPEGVIRHKTVDVAVAIATDGGLVTPVIRDVASRNLTDIIRQMEDFKERAKLGKLRQHELEGGSFSLSNLGMFGVRDFSAIINPPHAGILAVGAAEKRPWVVNDELSLASVMTCTVSADHRVLDGADAGVLLQQFKNNIENPLDILV